MIIMHMSIFETNYLHSSPWVLPCTWFQSMQFQSVFNKSYAIWDEVLFKGSPELYIFLGENSIIKSNKIVSFLPLISCHWIGSRQNFRNIIASDSLLSWDDIFWNCRWLALEPMKTSGWHSLVGLPIVLYITQCFSHMTYWISILDSLFSPLLFIFLTWSFNHSLTPIFEQPFLHSFPICICTLVLCHSTDAAFCLAILHHLVVLSCDIAWGFVYNGLCLHLQ